MGKTIGNPPLHCERHISNILDIKIGLCLIIATVVAALVAPVLARADAPQDMMGTYAPIPNLPSPFDAKAGDEVQLLSMDTPILRNGNYVRLIDRIELPDYARFLYNWLEEATDADGQDDWLIEDRYFHSTSGYDATGCEISGSVVPIWGGYAVSLGRTDDEQSVIASNVYAATIAFEYDHPEVFWFAGGGSGIIKSQNGSDYAGFWIYGDSNGHMDARKASYKSKDAITRDISRLRKQVATIILGTHTMGANGYTKVCYFNEWLTMHNQYNTLVGNNKECSDPMVYEGFNAIMGSVGTDGPVCEGYSKALKILCDAAGIECVVTLGMTNPGLHAWNLVKVFGTWYGVDVTWDDSSAGTGPVYGGEDDDYVLVGSGTIVSGKTFRESHRAWEGASINLRNEPSIAPNSFDPSTMPEQKDVRGASVSLSPDSWTYTGNPIAPEVAVAYGNTTLKPGVDYFVTYSNNVNAGSASLTLTGMEGFTGYKTVSFRIAKARPVLMFSSPSVVLSPDGQSGEVSVAGTGGKSLIASSSDPRVCDVTVVRGNVLHVMASGEGSTKVTVRVAGDANHEEAVATIPVYVEDTVAVWRLYNTSTGEHLYTASRAEYVRLALIGWSGEGVTWRAPLDGPAVWRLYHPATGKHLWTADANERRALLASGQGWRDEGICWRSDASGRTAVYRLYNPWAPFASAHHFTTDPNECASLAASGWRREGVCWSAVGM